MVVAPTRVLTKSNAQFQKAVKRLPLGVSSTFRYWGDDRTIYVDHGKGGRTWDIDGNNYVDYRLGYGPAILGYADDRVDAAARKGMEVGGVFALSTEKELVVADRIAKMVPAAELALLSNIEVMLAPLWVWWFLNETASPATFVGGAILLVAVMINGVSGARRMGRA